MTSSILPPEDIFLSKEELEQYLRIWSATHSFTFIIRGSTKERALRLTVTYAINRFRSGCQFAIKAKERESELWFPSI